MATSPSDPIKIDRLSNLPDALLITVLSLLPTWVAARTSVLSRRFRHLWEASPSLELIILDVPHHKYDSLVAMADRVLLHRDPSHALLSLRLDFYFYCRSPQTDAVVSSWLFKARFLGLRHLTMRRCLFDDLEPFLSTIFSINSLQSLSLHPSGSCSPFTNDIFPSGITLTSLKSLFLRLKNYDPNKLNRLLSELSSLEYLHLEVSTEVAFRLSSQTIRKLELIMYSTYGKTETVGLSIPSLELLHLEIHEPFFQTLPHIHGEIPLLRKAVITIAQIREKDVSAVAGLLNCISHAEELSLHIKERGEKSPFPVLLEPSKDAPNFPNLKHLYARMCFHEHNFEAFVTLLHHAPALESLKLVHETPDSNTFGAEKRKREDWASKLPCNADGNNGYAYFINLHLGENSKEFVKWLNKNCNTQRLSAHRPCVVKS